MEYDFKNLPYIDNFFLIWQKDWNADFIIL